MADIFVSYARADKERVTPIVAALEAQGWSVWWDPAIIPGQEFDDLIAEEIDKASAVVVVWTPASVTSRWVRGEAREAADRGVLVPVRFEKARLPIDVRAVHTTDIDDWKEDSKSAAFLEIVNALSLLLKKPSPAASAEPEKRETSICVLPFVNMSGDPEQEYFSDGLSEELLNQLAQLKGLRVAARTSSFAFKGQNPDLKLVSEKLGVEHILEGSVRKHGNRLRITAQLIKASDGFHLWSDTFNRELDDVFQIQEDIARAVADALKITLGMDESTLLPGGTKNVEAYDLYLRAQGLLRNRNASSIQRAIALFREAVTLDPRFAMAWLNLAFGYISAMIYSPANAEASRAACDEAFERAQACAPDAWMVHAGKANQLNLVHGDLIGADAAYAKARELAPRDTEIGDSYFLARTGRIDQAIEEYRKIIRLDPLATGEMFQFAFTCAGLNEEAEEEYKRVAALPSDPAIPTWFRLLRIMASEGSQTVKIELKRYLALNDGYLPVLNGVLAKFDDKKAVLAQLRQAAEEPFYQGASHLNGIAYIAAYFGDTELALKCLRIGFVDQRAVQSATIWHPLFAELRKTEGFKEIVRDLGLYDYWRTTGNWGDYARPVGDDDFEIIK